MRHSDVENSLVRVMHTERNHALCYTFSFELKATLKFTIQLKTFLAQQRIHSETCSGRLHQPFKNRQLFSDRTVAGVSPQLHRVVTFLHVSRFFGWLLCHLNI